MSAPRLVPIGGLGEFGANSMLLESGEGERLLLDAGAAFTDLESFGVGYEVPDYAALGAPAPAAVVFTHAHDDHIKGLGLLRDAFPDLPAWGSRVSVARVHAGFAEGAGELHELGRGIGHRIGSFTAEALPVSHSIPGTVALRVGVGELRVVLATDMRLAPSALLEETSLEVLGAWGAAGVDVLMLDSTNALVTAEPPAEATVAEALTELVRKAPGAVIAATFASHVGRFRQLALAAQSAGRVVVAVGRGLVDSLEVHGRLGGLQLPVGLVRPARELADLPHDRLVLVATGSQGEPGSAFSRLAVDMLPGFRLGSGDTILHAARTIPGNERRLAVMFDHCARRGARIVTAAEAPIHASGHAHVAELETLLEALSPRFVLPVHGRRRNLEALAERVRRHGARTLVVENGAELEWDGRGLAVTGEQRGLGRILIGDAEEQVLDSALLRDRRTMAQEGVIVAVLARPRPGSPLPRPEIHAIGLDLAPGVREQLGTELRAELGKLLPSGDADALRSTMAQWLRAELRRRTRRRPAVVALVMEL